MLHFVILSLVFPAANLRLRTLHCVPANMRADSNNIHHYVCVRDDGDHIGVLVGRLLAHSLIWRWFRFAALRMPTERRTFETFVRTLT
jgi:hypothetical protein